MTTPNLNALAKLAPFQHHTDRDGSWLASSGNEPIHIPLKDAASALNDWAELRAKHERTEAALAKLCRQAGNSPTDYEFLTPDDLRDVGLWREPGQGAT